MKKVLLIEPDIISPYRIDIFNILSTQIDLTVGYLKSFENTNDILFKIHKFELYHIGKFQVIKEFKKYCSNFDVVFIIPHYKNLSFCILPFLRRRFKVIGWSNGQRANYKVLFNLNREKTYSDYLTAFILRHCDANVIYIREAIDWLASFGIPKETIFAAQNTVVVNKVNVNPEKKKNILFVGTLYKSKGLDELIDCYYLAYKSNFRNALHLDIVGQGKEESELKNKVKQLGLQEYIDFHGAIYDEYRLSELFAKALFCISPKQAGLSVLKSLGYSCPFVTRIDAISGGEIVNVKNGKTGVLYNKSEDLVQILIDASINREKYVEMGENARLYYEEYASPKIMVDGFVQGVNYVCKE